MTVKEILTPIITKELKRYESQGKKIELKTAKKKRRLYLVICVAVSLLSVGYLFVPAIIVFFILWKNTQPLNMILKLAEKSPDTPIEQIVAQEIIH